MPVLQDRLILIQWITGIRDILKIQCLEHDQQRWQKHSVW